MEEGVDDAIRRFVEITSCSPEFAAILLQRCDNDIELAIRRYFDVDTSSDEHVSPPPSPQNDRPHLGSPFEEPDEPNTSFIQESLERWPQYTGEINNWYTSDFTNVQSVLIERQREFAVVYLHNPNNDDFAKFLFMSELGKKIEEQTGIMIGVSTRTQFAKNIREGTMGGDRALFIIIEKVPNGVRNVTDVGRDDMSDYFQHGPIFEAESHFATVLRLTTTTDEIRRAHERQETRRRETQETRALMQEQNRLYEESVKKDMERKRVEREKRLAIEKQEAEAEELRRLTEMREKKIKDYRLSLANEEPNTGTFLFQIRFPDGTSVKVNFKKTDSVKIVFHAAIKSEHCPLYFQVHTILPKVNIPCLPEWYYRILDVEKKEPEASSQHREITIGDTPIEHGTTLYVDRL